MSSRVYAIIPAGAGLIRKSRRTTFAETWSTQTIGCPMRAIQSSGTASATASGSAFWRATAFGTSSPSTTERYVRIENAIRNATVFESGGSMRPESSGSPMAPSRIAETVIPICTVLMNRTGSSIRRSAVRAPSPPFSARSSRRFLRPVTSAYSAATKIAFANTSRKMMTTRRDVLTACSRRSLECSELSSK